MTGLLGSQKLSLVFVTYFYYRSEFILLVSLIKKNLSRLIIFPSGLPEFENLCVQLWQDSNHPIAETVETHRPQTNSPPVSRSATSAPSPHTRSSHSSSTLNANLIQSPTSNRKTTTMMMSCARGSTELFGPDECETNDKQGLSSRDTTGERADSTGLVSHVLRERSDNVTTSPRPTGTSKSAPVRRRAARRGKLKHHKHCTEAQLIGKWLQPKFLC